MRDACIAQSDTHDDGEFQPRQEVVICGSHQQLVSGLSASAKDITRKDVALPALHLF